jgi:hypothetical protein
LTASDVNTKIPPPSISPLVGGKREFLSLDGRVVPLWMGQGEDRAYPVLDKGVRVIPA